MSVEQMRAAILKAYSTTTWAEKVARMPDNQVIATYRRLSRTNSL